MNGSQGWSATKYIKDFAEKSTKSYVWLHKDHYESCFNSMLSSMALSGLHSKDHIDRVNRYMSGYMPFFRVFALRVMDKLEEERKIDSVLLSKKILSNPILMTTYKGEMSKLIDEYSKKIEKRYLDIFQKIVVFTEASIILLLWEFVRSAKNKNIIAKLKDELYLLREIELFRTRKD